MTLNDEFNERTPYENEQIVKIKEWKNEVPGVISKAFGIVVEPLGWLVKKVVPEAAIRGALDFSNAMAKWLTDTNDIKRDACVENMEELKTKNLQLSDKLADEVHNWAIGVGVAEGAGTGVLGLPGIAVDIPVVITIALRTIHKIGVCYGYEVRTQDDNEFILAIMSAAGANSVAEKNSALLLLRSIEVTIAKNTWKKLAQVAAEKQIGKEAGIIALRNLAKQLGINLTKRKALAAIPFIGGIIGGSVNGWYIKEVGWAARRAFQERWLIDNHKIIDIDWSLEDVPRDDESC
ncbi:MAG: ATPase [Gracilibacter sp. BRH_c7a]|nr:MAG: ATPase [Gracilibacter sp. BRH_c7a]